MTTIPCALLFLENGLMKRLTMFTVLTTSLVITSSLLTTAAKAQIVELGDDIRVNFSNERRRRGRTNVRVYGNNGRLNVGVEEQRRPQTRVRVFDSNGSPSIDIREERPAPEERVRFSLPF